MKEASANRPLLMGSLLLTNEAEGLTAELVEWCKAKLAQGSRPVPLYAALKIITERVRDPYRHGLIAADKCQLLTR